MQQQKKCFLHMVLELLSPFISSGTPLPKEPDNYPSSWSTEIPEGVIITVVWHWHLRPASGFKPEKKSIIYQNYDLLSR